MHEATRAKLLNKWYNHRYDEAIESHRRLAAYFSISSDDFSYQAEAIYHILAFDPSMGWEKWQVWFTELQNTWQLSKAEHLLNLAEEQAWALDKTTQTKLNDYRRELLSFL